MASITRHGNGWRVRIRRGGVSVSETFRTKAEAAAWAVRREAEIIAGQKGQTPPGATFGDLLRRWRDEQIPRRDGGRFERVRIASLLGESGEGEPDPITLVLLAKIGPEHFAACHRNPRAQPAVERLHNCAQRMALAHLAPCARGEKARSATATHQAHFRR